MKRRQTNLLEFLGKSSDSAIESTSSIFGTIECLGEKTPRVAASSSNITNYAADAVRNLADRSADFSTDTAAHPQLACNNDGVSLAGDLTSYLLRRVTNAPSERGNAKRSRSAVQTLLDFGQDSADGVTCCGVCGMVFNATIDEDVRLHGRSCVLLLRKNTNAWLHSAQVGKALERVARPRRRCNAPARKKTCARGHGAEKEFCTRVENLPGDDFLSYVFDCGNKEFMIDAVARRLVDALRLSDQLPLAAVQRLVVVVHRRAGRLLSAVAGGLSTRERDPSLVLRRGDDGVSTHCYTRRCVTLCDVSFVWCRREAVCDADPADWWWSATTCALDSSSAAVARFFCGGDGRVAEEQRRVDALLHAALRCALTVLGRHVVYGRALCPRQQFSYDRGVICGDALCLVEAVTLHIDTAPLHTHADGHSSAVNTEDELSVVSYNECDWDK